MDDYYLEPRREEIEREERERRFEEIDERIRNGD